MEQHPQRCLDERRLPRQGAAGSRLDGLLGRDGGRDLRLDHLRQPGSHQYDLSVTGCRPAGQDDRPRFARGPRHLHHAVPATARWHGRFPELRRRRLLLFRPPGSPDRPDPGQPHPDHRPDRRRRWLRAAPGLRPEPVGRPRDRTDQFRLARLRGQDLVRGQAERHGGHPRPEDPAGARARAGRPDRELVHGR